MPDSAQTLSYLIIVNVLTYLAFGLDKYFALKNMWRISERKLLLLSGFGGTIGAYIGIKLFRHKTRKQPFRNYLHTIAVTQAVAVFVYMVPPLRNLAFQVFE